MSLQKLEKGKKKGKKERKKGKGKEKGKRKENGKENNIKRIRGKCRESGEKVRESDGKGTGRKIKDVAKSLTPKCLTRTYKKTSHTT